MNAIETGGLQHAIDRLVISGRRVFGWGWAAHPAGAVTAVHLRLAGDGWEARLPAGLGLARKDVQGAFPQLVDAAASGFVVTGFIPHGVPARVGLDVEVGGRVLQLDVTGALETLHSGRPKRRLLGWVAASVWRRLKRGDIGGILRRARAQRYGAPTLDDLGIVAQLLPALRDAREVCILFDHNMGGGANQYRRGQIAERLAAGKAVLLCTYNLPILEYRLHLFRPGAAEQVFGASTFLILDGVLDHAPVTEIFVNSTVSFDEPLVLAEWLARTRAERRGVRLTVTVHDYFAVCPSFVLLDHRGGYCGIPDIAQCVSCLKQHQASYVSLSPPSEIGAWRALWGHCLQTADEVRCFSPSSRQHVFRAYPALAPERVTVVPHRNHYVPVRQPTLPAAAPLVIGIVGEISHQKGAAIVKEMLDRIGEGGIDARIVVLGSLNLAHKSERLRVTGPYESAELVDLIEAHGINMFLFPSIWPETFSYVVGELISLGVPIVAFDLGAPGERLRTYGKARLCAEVSAAAALDTLQDFHRELSSRQRTAA
jgi:glycosyltransferase involved in cell wall biosynthesis